MWKGLFYWEVLVWAAESLWEESRWDEVASHDGKICYPTTQPEPSYLSYITWSWGVETSRRINTAWLYQCNSPNVWLPDGSISWTEADGWETRRKWTLGLLHDEISIKSGLVYDSRSGELVGFVNSSQRMETSAKAEHLATHALVFMVVGVTSNIKMAICYFPTRTATADEIFPLLWKAVGLLECVCNLKVGDWVLILLISINLYG